MIHAVARKLAAFAVISLMLAGAALVIFPYTKRIELRSAVPAFSDSAVVARGVDQVAAAIAATFNDGHRLGFSHAAQVFRHRQVPLSFPVGPGGSDFSR
jgi:hypothetical protein